MLNGMRRSRFLVLVLLAAFSSLLATVDGSLSSVLDFKLQPKRPNNLYYALRGSTFVVNCTVSVGNYTQALNLTWQHNKKWLFGEVKHIDTAMAQLTLSLTSSKNNGIYWCGPKLGHMSQGVNISLMVADPPSPPRNLRYSVVGAMDLKREYRVFWSASSVTGATPWPPLGFNVVPTDKWNELKVSWTARAAWRYTIMEYTILYHARNEMENKTKVISIKNSSQEATLLKRLKAFMEYYVYVKVRFVNKKGKKSAPSEMQGPRIVKTPAREPDTPSKVVRDWSAIFPGNTALRNVTVEWKLAPNSSWHGTPGEHLVYCDYRYLSQDSLPNCEYRVDATANRAVLQRLDSAKSYRVFIKMCNKERFCSARSEPYIIKKLQDNSTPRKKGGKLNSKQITLVTVSVVVVFIAVLVAIYLHRHWLPGRGILPRIRLRNRLILQPPEPPYNDVEVSVTNNYDQLNFNENQL